MGLLSRLFGFGLSRQKPLVPPNATYESVAWGDPPPSKKQFGYARSLGAPLRVGMRKWEMSAAIEDALHEQKCADQSVPADREQLAQIKEKHGVLPRKISYGEAVGVIQFLEQYKLDCPFCGSEIEACDEYCLQCNRSLKKLRIPIELPKLN